MQTENLQPAVPASEGEPEILLCGAQDGVSLPHPGLSEVGAGVHPDGAPHGESGLLEVSRFLRVSVRDPKLPPAEPMRFTLTFHETGYQLVLARTPYAHSLWFAAIETLTGMDRQVAMRRFKTLGWIDCPGYAFRGTLIPRD